MSSESRQVIKEIFGEAVRLPEKDRAVFIDKACGGDENLKREVASLLQHHRENTIIEPVAKDLRASAKGLGRILRADRGPRPGTGGGDTVAQAGNRRRVATITVAALLILGAVGFAVRAWVKHALDEVLTQKLETVLNADVLALEIWIEERLSEVEYWASDPRIQRQVDILARIARENPGAFDVLRDSPALEEFYQLLQPFLAKNRAAGAGVIDSAGVIIAQNHKDRIGLQIAAVGWEYISRVFDGHAVFVRPYRERDAVRNPEEVSLTQGAFIAACAPVRGSDGRIVAALSLRSPAEGRFSEILSVARMGESGETYAFDQTGLMLSESRFASDLKTFELIPDHPDSHTALTLEVRDPGVNLYRRHRPTRPRNAQPLTKLALLAIAGGKEESSGAHHGIILRPYLDYRGVRVIGAWRWLASHGLAIATEVDASEAYTPLRKLDFAFGTLFGLLTVATGGYLYSSFAATRLRREIGAARQLGSYTLIEKIGEGGMGEVYLASHAMLVRPTAIKVLKKEFATDEFTHRFEREVQLASQLSHPNTIEIYDYGRADDGVLYYAMEFIDGIDLAMLVKEGGPVSPARAIFVLRQICASLREAHARKIVHRDIKPQNVMLSRRAGDFDVVKVLDFGLVKDLGNPDTLVTAPARITGTPQYMAPERLRDAENVDARADLYSVGAVGYFLLSGRHLFGDTTNLEVLLKVTGEEPPPLDDVVEQSVPPALCDLVMRCLEKNPADRPESADEIIVALTNIQTECPWTMETAEKWWDSHAPAKSSV